MSLALLMSVKSTRQFYYQIKKKSKTHLCSAIRRKRIRGAWWRWL